MGRNSLATHHKHCNLHQEYLKRINHPSVRKSRSITQIINNETYIKIDNSRRKIKFGNGKRKMFVNGVFATTLDLNGSPQDIMCGSVTHTVHIGSPYLELFIDGEPHETVFSKNSGLNVELKYSENEFKTYRFRLKGPSPEVYVT
jgi:hypothetical protein